MITQSHVIAFLLTNTDGSDMSPMDLFHAGKEIMWPLLLLSFIGITVVVERLLFILRENSNREPEVVEKMLESVERRDIEGALSIGRKSKDFIAKILVYTITAAPLLGLLGTVTGMMRTFGALGTGDVSGATSAITGGVAEALIATACGLVVAIMGLLPFNYLNARAEQAKSEVADTSHALEILIKKSETNAPFSR